MRLETIRVERGFLDATFARARRVVSVGLIAAFDLLTLYVVYVVAVFVRKHVLTAVYGGFPSTYSFDQIEHVWWIFPIWIFYFLNEGLYTRWFTFWDEIAALWKVVFFSTVTVFVITSLAKLGDITSRTSIFLMGLSAALLLPLIRINLKRALVAAGWLVRKALILGAGHSGEGTLAALRQEPLLGYRVVGFLDDDPRKQGRRIEGVPVLGSLDDAERWIDAHDVKEVVLSMPTVGKERLAEVTNRLLSKVERVLYVPDLMGIAVLGTRLQHFFNEQSLAIEVRHNLLSPFNRFVKRTFDVTAGALLFIGCLPLLVVVALLIRLESRGPALFRQTRIGRGGIPFAIYKFRTMRRDSEEKLEELINGNEDVRAEWESSYKLRHDPRITRVGRFLRRTSLDELPQLINVVRGEMSLVGPRPVLEEELRRFYGRNREMYELVRPGLTGLWQVSGRNHLSYAQRVSLDVWYVKNWNLWLDIVMLLKTSGVVFRGSGAY